MTLGEVAIRALTVLLILAALGGFYLAAFNYWLSFGPPTPQPKDVYATRAWLALIAALGFSIGAVIVIWRRRRSKRA